MTITIERNQKIQSLQIIDYIYLYMHVCMFVRMYQSLTRAIHGKVAKNVINSNIYIYIYIVSYIKSLDPKQVTNCSGLQLESFASQTTKLGKRINCMLQTVHLFIGSRITCMFEFGLNGSSEILHLDIPVSRQMI